MGAAGGPAAHRCGALVNTRRPSSIDMARADRFPSGLLSRISSAQPKIVPEQGIGGMRAPCACQRLQVMCVNVLATNTADRAHLITMPRTPDRETGRQGRCAMPIPAEETKNPAEPMAPRGFVIAVRTVAFSAASCEWVRGRSGRKCEDGSSLPAGCCAMHVRRGKAAG